LVVEGIFSDFDLLLVQILHHNEAQLHFPLGQRVYEDFFVVRCRKHLLYERVLGQRLWVLGVEVHNLGCYEFSDFGLVGLEKEAGRSLEV